MNGSTSPCIKVCQLHWGTGWCFGCGRTGAEITNWLRYSGKDRDAALAALPARLAALGMPPGGDKGGGTALPAPSASRQRPSYFSIVSKRQT